VYSCKKCAILPAKTCNTLAPASKRDPLTRLDKLKHIIDFLGRRCKVLGTILCNQDVVYVVLARIFFCSSLPNLPSILTPPTCQYFSKTFSSMYFFWSSFFRYGSMMNLQK
jgi:hypothetical protein